MSRLVVVSNRVPLPTGGAPAAGGLAVALDGLLGRRGGLWFGWSGRIAANAERQGAEMVRDGDIDYATIDLTRAEHDRYYNNFSNGVLWPLLHTLPDQMAYTRRDAASYLAVNARFADALVPLLRDDDVLWVHDYHLMALPHLLRARDVHNPIGFFLHIPFATPDVIEQAPELRGLVDNLLSADLIGFQTVGDLQNFVACARRAGAVPVGTQQLQVGDRVIQLGAFPVEIEPREFAAAAVAATSTRRGPCHRLRESLGKQALIIGVDRLDPTKGLLQRLAGFRRLLEQHADWQRRVTLLQIAAVSRQEVTAYRDLRLALDRDAGAINGDFADPDWSPLRLVAKAGARKTMAGYMRLARVGLVTPLRDGMNLVAKEYVAAQDPDDPGVLVLSRFAGAAQQLETALIVNPYDIDALADAVNAALLMPLAERKERWSAMWHTLQQTSPVAWGRSFLGALTVSTAAGPQGRVQPMARVSR